jgi:glycerol-3-phosphate dehydrogenase
MAMNVILSEAKDLTIGMCVHHNHLKINEAKMIHGGLKTLHADERSLTTLGMTE